MPNKKELERIAKEMTDFLIDRLSEQEYIEQEMKKEKDNG